MKTKTRRTIVNIAGSGLLSIIAFAITCSELTNTLVNPFKVFIPTVIALLCAYWFMKSLSKLNK